jgi:hypothetical protein
MSPTLPFMAVLLFSLTLGAVSRVAWAQSTSEPLTDPTAFEVAYGLSFMAYDECGDGEAGRLLRRAVVERFEQCPFTPEAKAKFEAFRLETLEHLASEYAQAWAKELKPNPLRRGEFNPDGTPASCEDHRRTPRYIERRDQLLRYGRGEITAEQVTIDPCDVSPGAP